MIKVKRILKWSALVVCCLMLVVQFTGPARSNPVAPKTQVVEAHLQLTPEVAGILDRSCNDCHSNQTRWPWYSRVAPVSWFVIDHVNHGRSQLNFSEWGSYDRREAAGLLKEICQEVKSGAMPLSSYTPLHPGSKLSADDIRLLCDWTNDQRERLAKR